MKRKNQASKYNQWAPYLLAIFVGFCAADIILLNFRDLMLPTQAPPSKPRQTKNAFSNDRANYNPIVARNIFSSDGLIPDALRKQGEDQQDVDDTPVPSSLPISLIGTIVHSNPQKSIASIELKNRNQAMAFIVGSDIDGLASLVSVERKRAIIRNTNNGRLEYIEMKESGSKLSMSTSSGTQGASEVLQVAPNKFEIKRSDILKYTNNMAQILQQAAMRPKRGANGEIECFQFMSIQPGSIYTSLGFQNGDCIKGVNGEKVDSPQKALELYGALKNSDNIQLILERDGRVQNFDYSIK